MRSHRPTRFIIPVLALVAVAGFAPTTNGQQSHSHDGREHVHDRAPATTQAQAPSSQARGGNPMADTGPTRDTGDWTLDEAGILENHVQLTHPRDFFRAGEAYFSIDQKRIIFQAVRTPAEGDEPAEFYAMFLADVVYDGDRITGLTNLRELSPSGSANTCGWFDPNDSNIVYFGCTVSAPTQHTPPGYNRKTGRYKWMFPPEMRIMKCDLTKEIGQPGYLTTVEGDDSAYQAEDGLSPDGRHMVYCSLETGDGDLFIKDLKTGHTVAVVSKPGYDGGPFFSPDGKRICYRSDRDANHLLQVFVADLAFDANGSVTGIEREYQLTANKDVNWGPYWHPSGRFLIFAGSQVGHHNYEAFVIDADPGTLPGSPGPIRYGTRNRRVTHAAGADVLPVFSPDGKWLLWTSQRDASGKSHVWVADFVMKLDD